LVTAPDRVDLGEARATWSTPDGEVLVCPGPEDGHSCPLVEEGCCPIIDRVQVILNGLDDRLPEVSALLDVLASRYPEILVIDLHASA
jgi:hypothetical protein